MDTEVGHCWSVFGKMKQEQEISHVNNVNSASIQL